MCICAHMTYDPNANIRAQWLATYRWSRRRL